MGGVIDTSIFVRFEREGWTSHRVIEHLAANVPEQLLLSPIVATELVMGIYASRVPEHAHRRRAFVQDILDVFTVLPFTSTTAHIAGRMRGEQAKLGNTLPLADSLIAATAIEFGLGVLTHNLQDFTRIPNLRVLPFTA